MLLAAGLHRDPLEELTALPGPLAGLRGRGRGEIIVRSGREEKEKGGQEKGRGRKGGKMRWRFNPGYAGVYSL